MKINFTNTNGEENTTGYSHPDSGYSTTADCDSYSFKLEKETFILDEDMFR